MDAELDRLLEDALASYSGAEPRQGLEGRVLSRIAVRRRRPVWIFGGASVIAALMVLSTLPSVETMRIRPLPLPAVEALVLPRVRPAPSRRLRFPTPAPLTSEERAWMSAASSGVLADMRTGIEPIQIEDLTIRPLDEGGE